MGINLKHIFKHNGATEYDGNAAGNLAIGQGGVDVLTSQNDIVTAGKSNSIVGGVTAQDTSDVKQWIGFTTIGNSSATHVSVIFQVKRGINTFTSITLQVPVGTTLFGPFYTIKHNNTVTNGEAVYCIRG